VASANKVAGEAVRFGVVGVVNLAVDVGIFNVLRAPLGPYGAKVASTGVAVTSSYLMNRYWTWADRPRSAMVRQFVLFAVLSGAGLLLAEACLAVSRKVLGEDSAVADNVAANVVGLGLAMAFRFWAYRRWVFPAAADPAA
jgi:putative flippase GtrA